MRNVRSIEDVNSALRELYEFYDYMKTKNIDMNRRRIINAHPSIDLYDYVVRKELIDTVGGGQTPVKRTRGTGGGGGGTDVPASAYDKVTFGLGIGRSIEVGANATPPYIWTNSLRGRPEIIAVAANIPPQGGDLEFTLLHNGSTFTSFIFPEGTSALTVLHETIDSPPTIKRYDTVTCNVTSTGSIEGGREVEVVVFCPLIAS